MFLNQEDINYEVNKNLKYIFFIYFKKLILKVFLVIQEIEI